MPKPGDWIKLSAISDPAKNRIEANGSLWVVREVTTDKMLLRSAERTFGPPRNKNYDGMWIWKEHDPNYIWS